MAISMKELKAKVITLLEEERYDEFRELYSEYRIFLTTKIIAEWMRTSENPVVNLISRKNYKPFPETFKKRFTTTTSSCKKTPTLVSIEPGNASKNPKRMKINQTIST